MRSKLIEWAGVDQQTEWAVPGRTTNYGIGDTLYSQTNCCAIQALRPRDTSAHIFFPAPNSSTPPRSSNGPEIYCEPSNESMRVAS